MIRVLVLIAVTGFLVSVVTLSTAVGIGGPDAIARGVWAWSPDGHWNFGHDREESRDAGPQAVREIAWTGGDTLTLDVPAEVTYTQGSGPARMTVTGPQRALDNLQLVNGRLSFKDDGRGRRHGHRHRSELNIVMTAAGVSHFELNGPTRLSVAGYKQDVLKLAVSGDSEVTVKGEARKLELQIDGSAEADLSDLKLQDADVDIAGSGEATIAPTAGANLNISGSGDITLLTNPTRLESNVSGSGSIHHAERSMPSAPTAASPPTKTHGAKPGRT